MHASQAGMWLQMCLAYRNDSGRVCVVLSPVEKLEMEARLNELIPPASRFGTTFVVRQVRLLSRVVLICLMFVWPNSELHALQQVSTRTKFTCTPLSRKDIRGGHIIIQRSVVQSMHGEVEGLL